MRKPIATSLLLLAPLLGIGCARTFAYHETTASLAYSGTRTVAVATHDQRPAVTSGERKPEYVGDVRSEYGIPYGYWTESEKPLADDMTTSICKSLVAKGFKAVRVAVSPSDDRAEVQRKLVAVQGDRRLLLTLNQWKSDTYSETNLVFDATLVAMDKGGKTLGQARVQGKDDLGSSFWNAAGHAQEAVPLAFRKKLEELLNNLEIEKALR